MISGSKVMLEQKLEYTLLKPDYHGWSILKMQSGREDTLEERYAIKLCFKLGRNATKMYGMLQTVFGPSCMNRASVFEWHKRFKRGRETVMGDERCGGVRKSIHLIWLAKGLGLGLLCWCFKAVQGEIPSEEASTLQIGSVAFPPGQFTSPQLHTCHKLFNQVGPLDSSQPPYSSDLAPCDFWLFPKLRRCRYETIEERRECRSCWNGTTRALQPDEITSKGTGVSCVYYQ